MIVRVGHVLQDIKSSLAARKAVLNDHIAAATSVHAALGTPYSPDEAEHVKLLQRLWGTCFLGLWLWWRRWWWWWWWWLWLWLCL